MNKPKLKKGDSAKVVNKKFGHGFKIGDVVEVVKLNFDCDGNFDDYRCKGKKDSWWLREEELKKVRKVVASSSVVPRSGN